MRRARPVGAIAVVTVLVLAACSDDSGEPAADTDDTSTTSTTDAPLAAIVVADAVASPTTFNTLSTMVTATTDLESVMSVRAESDDGHVVETPPSETASLDHEVTLLGLRPDTAYELTLVATAAGAEGSATTAFTSGSLPDHFPGLRVLTSRPEEMAPGFTMLPMGTRGEGWPGAPTRPGEVGDGTYILAAFDESGEIVWYLDLEGRASDFVVTEAGTILYVENQLGIAEITTTGEVLRRWESRFATAAREGDPDPADTVLVDTDTMHHEITVLPNGNFVTLSTELLDSGLEDLPCETEQETDDGFAVIADVVIEFDPATGAIVNEWPLTAVLDPTAQPGAVLCDPVPFNTWYPEEPNAGDWTHANSIAVDPVSERLLVSVRHLNSVLALEYGGDEARRGGPLWQLGPGLDFELAGDDAEWQYMQHATEINEDGTLILYDNGNLRPGTTLVDGEVEAYTRAVIYQLDEDGRVATQLWDHVAFDDDGSPIYADFVGDADLLDNGNVLIGHGGIVVGDFVFDEELQEEILFARVKGRLLEVVPDATSGGETVFEVEIIDERIGWFFYAAERISSLQPLN